MEVLLALHHSIKDVHAVNNLLAFEAKRCFAELVRLHGFTTRSCQHSRGMQDLHFRDRPKVTCQASYGE